MKPNDIKKGDTIVFTDGSTGVMRDNKRGFIRTVERTTVYPSIGSCYVWDIDAVIIDGKALAVELTPASAAAREIVERDL